MKRQRAEGMIALPALQKENGLKYIFLTGILCALCLFCFWRGIHTLGSLGKAAEKVSFVCRKQVPARDARELLKKMQEEEEPLCPVFWTEEGRADVEAKLSGRGTAVRLVRAAGNVELLFWGGNALSQEDRKGCLISRDIVTELLGEGDCAGQILVLGNAEYEVRGVLEEAKGVMVVQEASETAAFDTLTMAAGGKRLEEQREILESRYGISGDLEEWGLLYGIARFVLLLFPVSAAAALLAYVRRNVREARGAGEKIFWKVCFWSGILGTVWGVASQVQIPADMLPSTWSDFAFWSGLWEEKRQAVSFLLEMEKRVPEAAYMKAFYESLCFGGAALVLECCAFLTAIAAIWRRKQQQSPPVRHGCQSRFRW